MSFEKVQETEIQLGDRMVRCAVARTTGEALKLIDKVNSALERTI